jgi:hypothetical protein
MSKPSYDKLIYAASLLSTARQERLERAKEVASSGSEARDAYIGPAAAQVEKARRASHAKEWEEGAARLAEVIKWLDGGAL